MRLARRWRRETDGGTMVEFTLIGATFFFMLFAILEGSLLLMWWNQTEKAVQAATRVLAVSPPVVAGLPETRGKNTAGDPTTIRYGQGCETAGSPCATVAAASCQVTIAGGATTCGDAVTVQRVIDRMRAVSPLALRNDAPGTITFTYTDTGLGFVGGPYIPTVQVDVVGVQYRFVAMAGLSQFFGVTTGPTITFPTITATLVGEDLNQGAAG